MTAKIDLFDTERKAIIQQLDEIGQLKRLMDHPSFSPQSFQDLLTSLIPANAFYKQMGGIAGYHQKIRSLLEKKETCTPIPVSFHAPSFIDISNTDPATLAAIEWGIQALPFMAEMIPLGGAADRLHLQDEDTGNELPAAKLVFAGKTLLERLIEDIQAREFLFFSRYGRQIITPIAMMTSLEKNNHFHVENMLEKHNWFGRPKDSFRIFTQPLVPVVNEAGDWLLTDDFKFVMKPGGHGAIWKRALDEGIFAWMQAQARTKILIRQINNPIAGLDYGLLAFIGLGWKKNKKFGFASCPRLLQAAEGVNILVEKNESIVLTNVEYCDFEKFGIEDLPLKTGEPYSRFSSNTNLLFGDLSSICEAVKECPFPGLLLNLKKGSSGRLESTMQNLADVFIEKKKGSLVPENTFITYNHRHKTISTTKKAFVEGGSLSETPEACFYDFMRGARELLEVHCRVQLPTLRSLEEYLKKGPEFVFLYHPCLGPLYSIIQQKICGGSLGLGSELSLEIRDLFLQEMHLDGSLQIISKQTGRCVLNNVKIRNQGIDWKQSIPYWKGKFFRNEGVEIILKGRSEFIAEDMTFEGSHQFVVEDGCFMRVTQKGVVSGYLRDF